MFMLYRLMLSKDRRTIYNAACYRCACLPLLSQNRRTKCQCPQIQPSRAPVMPRQSIMSCLCNGQCSLDDLPCSCSDPHSTDGKRQRPSISSGASLLSLRTTRLCSGLEDRDMVSVFTLRPAPRAALDARRAFPVGMLTDPICDFGQSHLAVITTPLCSTHIPSRVTTLYVPLS